MERTALLEDCILCANLDPNVKLTPQNVTKCAFLCPTGIDSFKVSRRRDPGL